MEGKVIAFSLPDFRGGGAEKVTISIANELSKRNKVYLIVGDNVGERRPTVLDSIEIIETGYTSGFKSAYIIKKICELNNVDVVFGTLGMAHGVAISKFLGNKSLCVSRIGNTISEDLKQWKGIKRFMMKIYQNVLFFADEIIVQSEFMRSDFMRMVYFNKSGSNVHKIYNPINTEDVIEKSNYNISVDITDKDFLVVGRLEKQKDTLTILKAFSSYSKLNPHCKLHILGDGLERQKLENYVFENNLQEVVLFHGFISNPYPYIKQCRAFIMASLYEGFSNAILEAVALNKIVIVSDCPGGNREIVNHGVNGFFFDVGNSEDLVEKIIKSEGFLINNNMSTFEFNNILRQYVKVLSK